MGGTFGGAAHLSEVAVLLVTFASREEAIRVAETVLAERLAACVNVLGGCTSLFRWNGAIERSDETLALFKTPPVRARRLRERISAIHSYELPVIEQIDASATSAVAAWLAAETG
jgi:periplasmic divalent cation tolerance protein